MEGKMKYTMAEVMAYLKVKGVPKPMLRHIREALAMDAVEEADNLHLDRIYTAFGLALFEAAGYEGEGLLKIFEEINRQMVRVNQPEVNWDQLMEELFEKTGIVVRAGDGDRIVVEYKPEDAQDEETGNEG